MVKNAAVFPVQTGIQAPLRSLDSGLRRNDGYRQPKSVRFVSNPICRPVSKAHSSPP